MDIAEGETIISEPPLYAVHPEALSTPAFMRRPDVARLFAVVEAGYDNDALYARSRSRPERCPRPAREGWCRLARHGMRPDSGRSTTASGGRPRRRGRDRGLVSARGRPLNGLRGRVDCSDGERWAVATARGRKSVRGRNLKTAGGIFRTNAYFDGGSGYVFETLCRANHSCAPNCAKAMSDRGGRRVVDVVALRDVPRGEEITVVTSLDARRGARRRTSAMPQLRLPVRALRAGRGLEPPRTHRPPPTANSTARRTMDGADEIAQHKVEFF